MGAGKGDEKVSSLPVALLMGSSMVLISPKTSNALWSTSLSTSFSWRPPTKSVRFNRFSEIPWILEVMASSIFVDMTASRVSRVALYEFINIQRVHWGVVELHLNFQYHFMLVEGGGGLFGVCVCVLCVLCVGKLG